MVTLEAKDLFIDSWSELSSQDAWRVVFLHQAMKEALTQENYTGYGHFLRVLLKQCTKKKHLKLIKKLPPEMLHDLYNDTGQTFHQPFTCFFTPYIKGKNILLRAPDEDLATMQFEHWAYADASFSLIQLYNSHGEKGKEAAESETERFIATLYIPAGCDFDPQQVDYIQKEISGKLYEFEKVLILRSFGNCLNKIVDRCPNLFPKQTDTEESQGHPVSRGKMWQELTFDLSHTQAFPGYDKAAAANIYKALDYLELQAVRNKEKVKSRA